MAPREEGRIAARPGNATGEVRPGLQALPLEGTDALLHVPESYRPGVAVPLVLALHGAGGSAQHALSLRGVADPAGAALLAVSSAGRTWDVILGGYGPDVGGIGDALEHVFARLAVDPARVVASGFSDGASYALSLGLTNGDLFTHVMAFSPGFASPAARHGAPRIFVSHGTADGVLPIDRCSRPLVPRLRRAGYEVEYLEFEGGHTIPPEVAVRAAGWLAGGGLRGAP